MRIVAVAGVAVLVGGCALPPAINIASLAIDGIILAATGKTPGDHALSMVTDQDCALWRVVKDEAVCTDYVLEEADTVMVADAGVAVDGWRRADRTPSAMAGGPTEFTVEIASVETIPGPAPISKLALGLGMPRQDGDDWTVVTHARSISQPTDPIALPADLAELMPVLGGAAIVPTHSPIKTAAFSPDPVTGPAQPVAAAKPPLVLVPVARRPDSPSAPVAKLGVPSLDTIDAILPKPARPGAGTYLVLASFRRSAQAESVARDHGADTASVMPAEVKGKTWYRVVIGPFRPAHAKLMRHRYVADGIKDAWLIAL